MEPIEVLEELEACEQAIDWVSVRPDATPQQLWDECPMGEWMLWLIEQKGIEIPMSWAIANIIPLAVRAAAWSVAAYGGDYSELIGAADRCEREPTEESRRLAYRASARASAGASDSACACACACASDSDSACASACDSASDSAETQQIIADRVRGHWPHPPVIS